MTSGNPKSGKEGEALRVGSLCSGYTGLDMGLALALGVPVEHAWFVEYDGINRKGELTGPRRILDHRYPDVTNYGDLTTLDYDALPAVDWLTAGYPCQPFSHAGKRQGASDERHLWPFVARAIGALRPGNVLLENVRGHVSLGLDAVLGDLAALRYDARWIVVRAADAGAPHSRARIFIHATPTADAQPVSHGEHRDAGRVDGASSGGASQDGNTARAGAVSGGAVSRGGSAAGSAWGRAGQDAPGAGLRQGRPAGLGRGRPDNHSLEAVPDAAGLGRGQGRPEPARLEGRPYAALGGLPTPTDSTSDTGRIGLGNTRPAPPYTDDAGRVEHGGTVAAVAEHAATELCSDEPAWGAYEPAIRRWERVTGRRAPRPTEPGRTGERLSPRFVEWMMGLPTGWVTEVPGLPRNAQLKALGNGVVPQQATLALRLLGVPSFAAQEAA